MIDFTQTLDLLRHAQDGDRAALEALFSRYYERVQRIVRMRLGTKLRSNLDSGDILQETFLAALKSFDHFEVREEAKFINWLARLAENKIRDAASFYGAKKRDAGKVMPLQFTDKSGEFGIDPVASGMLPPDQADQDEQMRKVEDCIHQLPDDYRELILLRDYAGMTWEDIAEQSGRPTPDAARMMHGKALVELAKLMRQE